MDARHEIYERAAAAGFLSEVEEASQLASAVLRLEGIPENAAADLLGRMMAAGVVSKQDGERLALGLATGGSAIEPQHAALAAWSRNRPAAG